jgi:hypothetical protein
LTQKKAFDEVSFEHLGQPTKKNYLFPGGTYAYTTSQPMVYLWEKPVSIESFWVRLHRSANPFTRNEIGFRAVQVFNGDLLVAE